MPFIPLFNRHFIFSFCCIIALLAGCSQSRQPEPEYIAKVGTGFEIDFAELNEYVKSRFYDIRFQDPLEAHLKALELLTNNQLKRLDFFDRGLHTNEELMLPLQRSLNEELMIEYFHSRFLDKYLDDDRVTLAYSQYGREVIYRQIVLMKPPNSTVEQLNDIKARVTEIRNKIDEGDNFTDLVSLYSRHPASAATGGYMNPVSWGTSYNSPVNYEVFQLDQGDIQTIETNTAFHIVEVTHVTHTPVEPLEIVRPSIINKLRDVYIELSQQEFDEYRESLIDKGSLIWNESAITQILNWAGTPGFFNQRYRETFAREIAAGNNFTILTHSGGSVDLQYYLWLLDNIMVLTSAPSYDRKDIKDHLIEAVIAGKISSEAREQGLLDKVLHPNTKNPVFRNQLLYIYNDHVIGRQIPGTSNENLMAFYEMVKDSTFYQLHTVYTKVILVDDEAHAEKLLAQYAAGTPFDDLAHAKLIRNFHKDRQGSLHTNHSVDQPDLAIAAFELGSGEAGGPFIYHDPAAGNKPAIMQVINILDEKILGFDEVENRIKELFVAYHRSRIENELIGKLREEHPVVVNKKLLQEKLGLTAS